MTMLKSRPILRRRGKRKRTNTTRETELKEKRSVGKKSIPRKLIN